MIIRVATEDDVAGIHRIERACFGDPWSASSFRAMLVHPQVHATVAERGGAVIGYCLAWIVGDEAELANIAVDPAARRQGVGADLLDQFLLSADGHGVTTTFLEVRAGNDAALRLYASRGFAPVGRRKRYYRKPDEDAIVMRRDPYSDA